MGSQFPDGQMEAEFEDDGRAAYFYLVHPEEGRVRSVWVYNRLPAPEEPAWDEEAEQNLAPLQPANLTSHPEPHPPFRQKDIEIYWDEEGMLAALFYAGEPFAVVTMDEEDPGYSRLATEDGPLARAWNEEVEALFMDEDEEEEGEEEA